MDEIPLPPQPPQASQPQQPIAAPQTSAANVASEIAANAMFICPQCHFPVKPEYYFCPNCGKNLRIAPLGTGLMDQILLYAFSLVLPWIAYLAITKWQGIKYLRSPDERTKQMGLIALVLLVVSSIVAFWLTYVWIQGFLQSQLNSAADSGLL